MATQPVTPAVPRMAVPRPPVLGQAPPCTTEERLVRIEALGRRIEGYIQFMCQSDNSNGTSADAKERAVAAFYLQMVTVERQLARIQESFQLE